MNYIGKDNEVIESVKEFALSHKTDNYIGLYIKTNYDTYKFMISDFRACCEEYGVSLSDNCEKEIFDTNNKDLPNDFLKGYALVKIEYSHEKSNEYTFSTKLVVRKVNEPYTTVYYINISNGHNGYYPHGYIVEWSNYKNEGEL